MQVVKCKIKGSDYVGVFATATDRYVFAGQGLSQRNGRMLAETLKAEVVEFSISGSDLVGLFSRANSNGIVLSNLITDEELERVKRMHLDLNIEVIDSELNAIGSNILANDKIAIANIEYDHGSIKRIADALGVEVLKEKIAGFKTVGANNILTNTGLVINNRSTDAEKAELERISGFEAVRTTANTGSLSVGLSAAANSDAVVIGDNTTGFELARILEALER